MTDKYAGKCDTRVLHKLKLDVNQAPLNSIKEFFVNYSLWTIFMKADLRVLSCYRGNNTIKIQVVSVRPSHALEFFLLIPSFNKYHFNNQASTKKGNLKGTRIEQQ